MGSAVLRFVGWLVCDWIGWYGDLLVCWFYVLVWMFGFGVWVGHLVVCVD